MLAAKEWAEVKSLVTNESYWIIVDCESGGIASSELALAHKRRMEMGILGSKRSGLIKWESAGDVGKIHEAGLQAGNATLDNRRELEIFVDSLDDPELKLQRDQLKFPRDSRITNANDSGNDVQLQQPEKAAQEVRWVLRMQRPVRWLK